MVLITGSTGFIGRRVVPLFYKHYTNKIICVAKPNLNVWEIKGKTIIQRLRIKMLEADILNIRTLIKLPKSPSLIIHLAATTDTSEPDYTCNDIGTKNLFKSLGKLGPKNHVIFTSTTALMAGRKSCSQPFDEISRPKPTNEYGRSKLKAERFLIKICKKDKFKLTIIRLTTVYGPDPRKNSFFDIMKKLVLNKSLLARLNWPGLTGLIHVNDVAESILEISKKSAKPGLPKIYILNTELLTFAEISQYTHSSLKIKYSPINLPTFVWKLFANIRTIIYSLEYLLPVKIYNMLWRASLLVDNVIYCEDKVIKEILPNRRLRLLKGNINNILS